MKTIRTMLISTALLACTPLFANPTPNAASELKAKDEEFAKVKQQFCDQARRQIATMEAKGPVATVNEKGEQQLMNADQRMEEIERVRKQMAENCK